MSSQFYYEELSEPFVFNNDFLCRTLKAMSPAFSQGECILAVLPPSFKKEDRAKSFCPGVFYMLSTSMTYSALVDGTKFIDHYDTASEYLHELLTHFGNDLITKQMKPHTLLVDTPYAHHFLMDFCEKCGIELKVIKELKQAYYFVSIALFEEGSSDAVVEALGGDLVEIEDYYETPEEFSALYYPKFMESKYAKGFSKEQLTSIRPYIELFSKKMWDDEDEIPFEWSESSLKKTASMILHENLSVYQDQSKDFLPILISFLKFLDTVLGCDISTELLPAIQELMAEPK